MIAAMEAERGTGFGQTRGFLFSDLRGYTDFVERHGDDAAARLLDRYRTLVRNVVARNSGAEVRTEGDSFYVVFPSASGAVAAALDIVRDAGAASTEQPDAPIRVGIGVHAGETSDLPDGPVGSAVNIAARICAQAQAGEILVSDTVRGLTRTRQVATFVPVGTRRLKGIAEPMALYRALPVGASAPGPVITSRLGRPTSSSWINLAIGGLALLVLALVGYAVLNGYAAPGASSSAPASGIARATVSAGDSAMPSQQAPGSMPHQSAQASAAPTAIPVSGTRIIYSRQLTNSGGGCDEFPLDAKLHVLDPDHLDLGSYRLTYRSNLAELDPGWSEDGQTIAFIGSILRGPGGINTVDVDRENLQMLAPPREVPGLDMFGELGGNRVLVSTKDEAIFHFDPNAIYRTPLGGGPVVTILQPPEDPEAAVESHRDIGLRPDGSLLVVVGGFEGGPSHLETVSPDGQAREPLDLDISEFGDPRSIALAADGTLLAIASSLDDEQFIFVGNITGEPSSFEQIPIEIADARGLNFSPDGSALVFQAGARGSEQLYLLQIEPQKTTQLTEDPGAIACRPVWRDAPDNLAQPMSEPTPGEPRPFELGQLVAGTYLNDLVTPRLSLTFDDGWFVRRSYVDGWSVFVPEQGGEVDSARLQVGAATSCSDEEHQETVAIDNDPVDVIGFVQGREDLETGQPQAINLGGYTGLSIEVTGKEGVGCDSTPDFEYWSLFHSGEDFFSLGPTEHLRLIALDVRGTTVSFLVFTSVDQADEYWETYAEPLLRTVTFPED